MGDFRHSFAGDDTQAIAVIPGASFLIEELTNFSVSTHIEKKQVRRVGHTFPVGWAVGSGTVAGTFVFAQLTESPLYKLRSYDDTIRKLGNQGISGSESIQSSAANILPEQLPPFHIVFVHMNESGQMGVERLYDVTIQSGGKTTGQQNKFTEQHFQFKALYYENLHLMQSLTTEEMASLAGQDVGFFNDFRRAGSLIDGVADAVGTSNLAEYVSDSTLGNFEAYLEGDDETNPISIADQGDVVYADAEDGEVPEAETAPDTQTAKIKSRGWRYEISDTVVMDVGGFTTESITSELVVDGKTVHIVPDATAEASPSNQIGSLPPGAGEVSLPANQYYERLLQGSGLSVSDLAFIPDTIVLEVGENGAYRTSEYDSLDLSRQAVPPEGTYVMSDMDYLPDQTATVYHDANGDIRMVVEEGPFLFEEDFSTDPSETLYWLEDEEMFSGEGTFAFDGSEIVLTGDLSPYASERTYESPNYEFEVSDSDLKLEPLFKLVRGVDFDWRLEETKNDRDWEISGPARFETPEFNLLLNNNSGIRADLGYFVDRVSFVHENAGSVSTASLLDGEFRGANVDLEVSNGTADGTFAGVNISGQTTDTYFEPVSGAGFDLKITGAGADLQGSRAQIG